MYRNFEKN